MSDETIKKQRKKIRSKVSHSDLSRIFILSGIGLTLSAICLIAYVYYPILAAELTYQFRPIGSSLEVTKASQTAKDTEFGIVIPTIGVNSTIVADVNPFDSSVYQKALTKGVAHAKGSAYPDTTGNVFIFSHSSVNFLEATRYNSIFYLLSKLKKGDLIFIYFKNTKYTYSVDNTKIVDPKEISYLSSDANTSTLTLMTCWPPGTNIKRLVVISSLQSTE